MTPTPTDAELDDALAALQGSFRERERVLVAFSGGVDSALLARVGDDVLGEDCLSVVVDSESFPAIERREALEAAEAMGVRVEVVDHAELADPRYVENTPRRCYFCRQGMSELLAGLADARGFHAVAVGNHATDLGDLRPGMQAVADAGLWQPYLDHDVGKPAIRALAHRLDVPVHDKPSMACLSSRIPHGQPVTLGKLERIEDAEAHLRTELGFEQVRVRTLDDGDRARVEVLPGEVPRLRARWGDVVAHLEACGYREAELDEDGYRTGKLHEETA